MKLLARIFLRMLQVVVFFVLVAVGANAWTNWNAKTYAQGDEPSRLFPVVGVRRAQAPAAKPEFQLLRWSELESNRSAKAPLTFALPETQGRFNLEARGGVVPAVAFAVTATNGGWQSVEVRFSDSNYDYLARYSTDGAALRPEYLRTAGPESAMIAFIPALFLAWLLGRLVAWLWNRRAGAPERT